MRILILLHRWSRLWAPLRFLYALAAMGLVWLVLVAIGALAMIPVTAAITILIRPGRVARWRCEFNDALGRGYHE